MSKEKQIDSISLSEKEVTSIFEKIESDLFGESKPRKERKSSFQISKNGSNTSIIRIPRIDFSRVTNRFAIKLKSKLVANTYKLPF